MVSSNVLQNYHTLLLLMMWKQLEENWRTRKMLYYISIIYYIIYYYIYYIYNKYYIILCKYNKMFFLLYCLFRWPDVHPLMSTLVCYIHITHLYGLVFLLFLLLCRAAHMQAQNYCTINVVGGGQNLKNWVKNKIHPNHNVFYSSSAATRSNSFPVWSPSDPWQNPSCKWSKWDFCV